MGPLDVDAYLTRIGYDGSRAPTLATLRALHLAHLYRVPFENLDIHRGRRIRLDPEAFFAKVVGERRGGFCYELNGLFAALLGALGFDVTLLSARVARKDGSFGAEFDHMTLLVRLEQRWLADVGFGRCFQEPMLLDAPVEHESDGTLYRVVADGEGFRLESRAPGGEPEPEYVFSLVPRRLEDFAGMCAFHQTSPESHFTRRIVCSLPLPSGGRVTVSGQTLIESDGDARRETPLADERAVRAALLERFGIRS